MQLDSRSEEAREFYAYVNHSGVLINEGIVATERFVEHLAQSDAARSLFRVAAARRRYVALSCDEGSGRITVGIRKLGSARLKGLGSQAIYEVIDGDGWNSQELEALGGAALLDEVEKDFEWATSIAARRL